MEPTINVMSAVQIPEGEHQEKSKQDLSCLDGATKAPQPSKAAVSRASKARKPKFPADTPGAENVNLTADEKSRAKKTDEENARQEYLKTVNEAAAQVAKELSAFTAACKEEDEAKAKRLVFADSMRAPAFRKKMQDVRDFFATRKVHEFLMGKDGTEYKTAVAWFKGECRVTYDYVRKLDSRFSPFKALVEDAQQPLRRASLLVSPPREMVIDIPDPETVEELPQQEETLPQEEDLTLSLSLEDKVRKVVAYADGFTRFMSPSEKDDFYSRLLDKIQTEKQFPIESMTVTEVTAVTA